jgi:type IV secretory pathway TrbL component
VKFREYAPTDRYLAYWCIAGRPASRETANLESDFIMKKLATLFACMAMTMFAVGCGEAENAVEGAKDAAGDAVESAKEAGSDMKEAAGDAVKEAGSDMKEAAGEAADKMKDAVGG